jgi:hypothetical protein
MVLDEKALTALQALQGIYDQTGLYIDAYYYEMYLKNDAKVCVMEFGFDLDKKRYYATWQDQDRGEMARHYI